jgi:hypothetical protein
MTLDVTVKRTGRPSKLRMSGTAFSYGNTFSRGHHRCAIENPSSLFQTVSVEAFSDVGCAKETGAVETH